MKTMFCDLKRAIRSWATRTSAVTGLALCLPGLLLKGWAGQVQLTVQVDQPGARVAPTMWGIFFEDINLGADGGLYAELVKNRGFEFPDPMMGWFMLRTSHGRGEVSIRTEDPFDPANPHYARIESRAPVAMGLSNEGFRGMGFRGGEEYVLELRVRRVGGNPRLLAELVNDEGETLAEGRLTDLPRTWEKRTLRLTPRETASRGRLNVLVEGGGTVDVDMVSLFPRNTWKQRPGGLRADLVQMLAELKPGFLRFPGGCIVEGSELDKRYQWKTTIGPVEQRRLLINRWNYEFKHRPTPDYYQSFGLGFFEYFQLAEDLGAEPLPILNCGMACQFNSGELVPLDQLEPYVQDALDLIEFANGPVDSPWGARRAAMGHPEPFHLKYIGIGNEQWGPQYLERYAAFARVLKERHPEITLVSSSGPSPHDDRFDFLWPRLVEMKAEIVDQHCYANPIWFFTSADRFDRYDPAGPKVFFGEYAAQSDRIVSVHNRNNWECALSEAAFMTGMERNAAVVVMAAYAPLFGHVDGWQWRPNLIWFDNLRVFGTPNYYVQQMFSRNRGDRVLPVRLSGDTAAPALARGGIGLGTYRTAAEFKDLVVRRGDEVLYRADFSRRPEGWRWPDSGSWEAADGVLRQTNPRAISTAFVGGPDWTEYTLEVKARKIAGDEGFLVVFRDAFQNTRVQWNIGGWGNTRHGIQSWLGVQEQLVEQVPGSIETGRWYDIRVVLRGPRIECYLDGRLIHAVDVKVPVQDGFYASAVSDETTGEVILKLVNAAPYERTVQMSLEGVKQVRPGSRGWIMRGETLGDENDFEHPTRVAPRDWPVNIGSPQAEITVPSHALIIVRVPVER
ncbi:alpha-N-arabinofuranosidase [Limisphaera ngatamarikiensis]|uniref:non-reducing end alpha-L-arabinofuranosidase n=1 Tax=Limisphaera ngatamarikiensis TaxID=1324935 RepID=A0A6M1RV35_9BACT|nr:alpha-L-arabinofuranosidase C-terminal domain-containing protein [Limisphaera ngatamarikiensis]NGO38612.1 alpha-N-arabinofuranosidase [Limisphaera ngatamarikiensis]